MFGRKTEMTRVPRNHMGDGIHAEVEIGDPVRCQVARYASGPRSVHSVTRTGHPEVEADVLEEFTVGSADRIPDGGTTGRTKRGGPDGESIDIEESFVYGDQIVYRMERSRQGCVCEQIEAAGSIVRDVEASEGCLEVRFVAPDVDAIQTVLGRLNDAYDEVHVRRLRQSEDNPTSCDTVMVDRGLLTDRQREVLATAHRHGYFEHPRGTSATAVAEALGVTTATFTEHLAAAQRKLMDELL